MNPSEASHRATDLVTNALLWDAHAGIFPGPDTDLSEVSQWRDAGVDYVSINVGFDVMHWQDVVRTISAYRQRLGALRDRVKIVKTTDDVHAARSAGLLAVSFDIEGVNALNDDIGMVSVYRDLGVRQMLLAYNLNNTGSGGCHDDDPGLSPFGREVVTEMNRVGMLVDCAHMGERSSLEAMECSDKPAVFSHSNPNGLCAHQRNITDNQIKICAANGGVIGVNGMGIFLGDNDVTATTFARHVNYIADLVGPDHVGFGLDWKPKTATAPDLGAILASRSDFWPKGQRYDTPSIKLFHPRALADVVAILFECGWTEKDLRGFLGGNFMRVASQSWKS